MVIEELKALQEVNEIKFTEDEEKILSDIFSAMEKKEEDLAKIDTENLKIMVYVRPLFNVFREDKRVQPFAREDLLKGAPQSTEDSWQVPRLVK